MSTVYEMIENKDIQALAGCTGMEETVVYADSLCVQDGSAFCAVKSGGKRYVLASDSEGKDPGVGGDSVEGGTLALWNTQTAEAMRKLLPWTKPTACGKEKASFGTGDRLGVAGPAHVRCVMDLDVFPVLAQQSTRELTQTERTYQDVIDCASWAVFQEGYTRGFGADGDHLKTLEDVITSVETGATMITLDLSEKLRGDAFDLEREELEEIFEKEFDEDEQEALLAGYENHEFTVGTAAGTESLKFLSKDVLRNAVCYYRGIEFAAEVYHYLEHCGKGKIDFEVSIDEVGFPTHPKSHYFVANELDKRMIEITSMAPCFVGEFQKAIDYIGDIGEFEKQLDLHVGIAREFGNYKISIHSGSDKFSVYPLIGRYTEGLYHVKTAGTSWVEAVKMIALKRPELYREVHSFALESFEAATELYHVTTDLNNIPSLDTLGDAELVSLFENNDARQLIHITYGFILRAKNEDGSSRFRNRLYQAWDEEEDAHYELLENHIGHHLELLEKR